MSLFVRISTFLCFGAMVFATPAMSAPASNADTSNHDIRVMTFNVRYPNPDDGINVWPNRRGLMVRIIRTQHPDIIGTQELFTRQGDYLVKHLKHYKWFGLGRNGNNKQADDNEHMGVFYNARRLRIIQRGNFWLSATPNVPGSVSWGQLMPRMVTWAEFQDKQTGKRFYFYDTHLPYRSKDVELRKKGVKVILKHLAKVPDSLPIIVTGDFNSGPDSPTHALMTTVLHDAWVKAPVHHGPAHTFHDFTGHAHKRIDYIYYRGVKVDDVRTITTHHGKVYPSDHFPVMADFSWTKPAK
ncbi:MAG TPA: endonuclease/exonuclease/phosphatase family protein [Oleiagrimonas sp.]|nr:endonuclease/exonuclease/phosphatase family protein [Oleiagrimonas sp.]